MSQWWLIVSLSVRYGVGASPPLCFTLRKRANITPWTGGWLSLRAILSALEKRSIAAAKNQTKIHFLQQLVYSLYRLSYPTPYCVLYLHESLCIVPSLPQIRNFCKIGKAITGAMLYRTSLVYLHTSFKLPEMDWDI